jgi:hypothetical protein
MFSLMNRSKIYVKQFSNEGGSPQGAVLSFQGKIKDDLLRNFMENYNVEGDHIKKGGAISPQSMLTLIGSGAGSLGLSGLMSGNLFMATANPKTLMAIGNGVGSAVMGAGGVVAQAPFIPMAAGLMPVVAPLLAFQAITTVMLMNQFKGIHERLDHIEKSISRIIQRSEATYVGEIISGLNRIEELEHQFSICNKFTQDMMIRLALAEDKVNPIFERYKFLYQTQFIDQSATIEELKFKQNDAYFAIILSILDLRIDLLQLKLAIQENAGYMKYSADRLVSKVDHYRQLWHEIGMNPRLVETVATELKEIIDGMNQWEKTIPTCFGGKRSKRVEAEKKIPHLKKHAESSTKAFKEELVLATQYGKELRKDLAVPQHMNLIYWRDQLGEHSYYTSDLELLPVRNQP